MTYHLVGGVTPDEAKAILAAHGVNWRRCHAWACPNQVTAVLLLRSQSGRPGSVQGAALCAHHEAQVVSILESSEGYVGADLFVEAEA